MMGIIATTVSILIMLKYLLEKLPTIRALFLMLMAYGLLMQHIMPRPHILTLPIMTFWFVQLLKANERHQAPSHYLCLNMGQHLRQLLDWYCLRAFFLLLNR